MVGRDNALQRAIADGLTDFDDALREAAADLVESPRQRLTRRRRQVRGRRTVRSVQRLPHPGRSASWVGREYIRWLPSVPMPGLSCEVDGEEARFSLRGMETPLLVLRSLSTGQRDLAAFEVVGGLLARVSEDNGRLEFRSVLDGRFILAAVHDFEPTLPWLVYQLTQAVGHLMVMRSFGGHLHRVARSVA